METPTYVILLAGALIRALNEVKFLFEKFI